MIRNYFGCLKHWLHFWLFHLWWFDDRPPAEIRTMELKVRNLSSKNQVTILDFTTEIHVTSLKKCCNHQPSTKQISIQTFGAELPSCKCSFALVVAWKYRPAPDCLRFRNLPWWRAMENCWFSRDLQQKKTWWVFGEIVAANICKPWFVS